MSYEKPKVGISVDAGGYGNPGLMFYRGVDLETNRVLFDSGIIGKTTNNVAEFLAICHAVHYLKKHNLIDIPIYSDSQTAISWVNKKKCNTSNPYDLKERVYNAVDFINKIENINIKKWITPLWGECPADFGRK